MGAVGKGERPVADPGDGRRGLGAGRSTTTRCSPGCARRIARVECGPAKGALRAVLRRRCGIEEDETFTNRPKRAGIAAYWEPPGAGSTA